MHIDFDQKLQQISSNQTGDFLVEEIDLILNEHMLKFIEYRSDPKANNRLEGFEESQKRYDNIESLVTIPTEAFPVIGNGIYSSAFLPSDYLKLVSEKAIICCSAVTNEVVTLSIYNLDLFIDSHTSIVNYTLTIVESEETIFSFSKADYTTENITNDNKIAFRNLILDKLADLADTEITIGWERVGNYSRSNQLVVVGINRTLTISISSDNGTEVVEQEATVTTETTTRKTASVYDYSDCNLKDHETFARLSNNYFGKSTKINPTVTINRGELYIHHNSEFSINGVFLTYIRNPILMNKGFGINCELGSTVGQRRNITRQIVDAAVASAAKRIMADNGEALNHEFLTTE